MSRDSLTTVLKVVAVILLFCIFGVSILLLDRVLTPKKLPAETFEQARAKLMSAEFDGDFYLRKNVETYLIAGLDKYENDEMEFSYGGRNNNQADFIVLLVVNKSARRIDFISVNRDTLATVDVVTSKYDTVAKTRTEQICFAHTYGDGGLESGKNLCKAVEHLFYDKIRVDHFLTMKMDAVKAITDYLEGVNVTLEENEDLSVVDPEWIAGKTIALNGENALKFIRYRDTDTDGSNAGRIDRQSRFLKELLKTVGEKKWSQKYLLGAYEAVSDYSVSDYGNVDDLLADMNTIFEAFGMYEYGKIVNLVPAAGEGDIDYGHYESRETYQKISDAFILNEDNFKKLVISTFFRKIDDTNKD